MVRLFCHDTIRDEKGNIVGYKVEEGCDFSDKKRSIKEFNSRPK